MTRTSSPYRGRPESWSRITRQLLDEYPLTADEILDVAQLVWADLWKTMIGSGDRQVRLADLTMPASVVGYFFEILFARELERRSQGAWRGGRTADEKDLVYGPNLKCSTEIKTSGQLGYKVYGNRSHGQKGAEGFRGKKEKSGYYITVNFFQQTLTLLRFGWIDAADWTPQHAPTGQMAGLSDQVYQYKLIEIRGAYQLNGPVQLLPGIGGERARRLEELGIRTIGDLVAFSGELPLKQLAMARDKARERFRELL